MGRPDGDDDAAPSGGDAGDDDSPDDCGLPTVQAAGLPATDGSTRVVGVLLAAGSSRRFGCRNKLLADCGDAPIVARAVRALTDADLAGVVAVVGHEADRVAAALPDGVDVVENEAHASGQASSLRAGVAAARDRGADAVVVALGDMPYVAPATTRALVTAHEAGVGSALAAAHHGERGNPVLFDRRHFDVLTDVDGDVGGRDVLLGADDAALVDVPDSGVRRDIDRPTDVPEGGTT
jgi:molybdenum cofactor cytidylyltransferase